MHEQLPTDAAQSGLAPRQTNVPTADVQAAGLCPQPEFYRFLAITPFERPDVVLARALLNQHVAVAIDIGRDQSAWPALFDEVRTLRGLGLGLRIPDGVSVNLRLPEPVQFLVAAGTGANLPPAWRRVPLFAQVCSLEEGQRAVTAGAAGLIAKGQESGGLVGEESSFVLLQQLIALVRRRATGDDPLPVWCQGGIGLHTAAGVFAGGAFGIVIDSILAAFPQSTLPMELKTQILAMDGSEVHSAASYRVYARTQGEVAALEGLTSHMVQEALARRTLLPIGQDAALGRIVLNECATLDALIHTLRMRVAGQVQQAQTLRVLDMNNAWARSHGTCYPVAQGPMTRVSDTAPFAAAVAEAGGLPFLALSLMKEEACRKLLEATREELAGRPWGAGLLGFAPPEILDPQLALVKQFKPSVLLLAGGRPSQARPFVDMGIPVYLHVPSPGLLDIFLKEGATHFVFEGRECGGHVGPRYSFVLWEQALARLAQTERPEQLHILFAGGIHDERSAAMVAAIAAPLAARGAKIGVLMGTAYITTFEAVSCGAVLKEFQQQALSSTATTLVETAPGHAIRCLPSGFIELFTREKARLQHEGVEQKEAWRALETLTVGRLRVATKGVEYSNGQLVPVDFTRQEAEGMYMIGQVITMKEAVTTIADLHAQVTRGAMQYLREVNVPPLHRTANAEPIAVVGMACLYPGSPDLESFWSNILENRDLVGEVPAERWNAQRYYSGREAAPDKSVSKWGGFIEDTPFDPLEYGIPPASLAAIEPVQLLSLEVARQALKDAGYENRWFDRDRTSVIFGAEAGMDLANQYTFRNLYSQYCGDMPQALANALPSLTEDSFPGMLVNVISGRIANRLGFGGVNYSVTSACASSLTAIELGVKELRGGTSETVLAGGADFHNGISDFLMFSSVGALSTKGRCRSFDNDADGIALGEGVGVIVLKRLADAERDGDRIYAVIDSVAGSSDGKGLGLTAPRKEGQKRALERAYWQAGVLPAEMGLVEAHGTGTVVGDRTELQALTEVYGSGGAVPGQTVLGSVKSQIGHTKCAAGIAGVIKAAKALHHRVLPPTGQITNPNAWYRPEISPFQLNDRPTPWLRKGAKARAAVSAFGFGGANFHALLSAYPAHQETVGAKAFPAELFAVRGENMEAARATLRQIAAFCSTSNAPVALRDLARSAWEAGTGVVQIAFVATDIIALKQRLAAALSLVTGAGVSYRSDIDIGKTAVLFPGQGSQYPGMLRDLFVYFPILQNILEAGPDLLPVIFPPTAYDQAARAVQQSRLTDTKCAQPALGLIEWAAFEWLSALGLKPDMSGGHSYGELVALATAGAFDSAELLALSRARAEAMAAAIDGGDAGAMAAVRLDAEQLKSLLADFPAVVMANQNSPVQTVISGPTADVEAACASLGQLNIGCKRIATACAFHSPLMAAAEQTYAEAICSQPLGSLKWPVYSNETAEPHCNDAIKIRNSLPRNIVSPVRFAAEVERMYADGARLFIEIGPSKVLTGLVRRILNDRPHTAIALDPESRGLAGLFETLAQLSILLPAFDASPLYARRADSLDFFAPKTLSATTWMVNGGRAWPLKGDAPPNAAHVVLEPVVDSAAAGDRAGEVLMASRQPPASDEQAIIGYLTNMRELVNAQRDVLLGYFGAPTNDRIVQPAGKRGPASDVFLPAAIEVKLTKPSAEPLATNVGASEALQDSEQMLLTLVSERTGYPVEMLDLDLDLEADLSIDSIKRLEIIGALSQRLDIRANISGDADTLLEQLTAQKTLRAMLAWLTKNLSVSAPVPVAVNVETADVSRTDASVASVSKLLIDLVSQCTGYPPEMLDLDLDLEADLSIDSIKRLEVIGQLCTRLGVAASEDRDTMLEDLRNLKTLQAMIHWLEQRYPTVAAPANGDLSTVEANSSPALLERYVLRHQDAPPPVPGGVSLAGKRFLISDDQLDLAPRVQALLHAQGASSHIIDFRSATTMPDGIDHIDGLIHLWSLNSQSRPRDVKRFFAVVRESVQKKGRHLLVASALGGDFGLAGAYDIHGHGGGFAGLLKSLVREFPELRAHSVDFDPSESRDMMANAIVQELLAESPPLEVAYRGGSRYFRTLMPAELTERSLDNLPLTPKSVVLLTGGSRGITALIGIELTRRYRCHLEVVGRSPQPEDEESEATRGIDDPLKLRQALLAINPALKPVAIERQMQSILAGRAARDTYAQVIAAGGTLNYTQLDVRDSKAFFSFIDQVYAHHGRIDGVIHGAGVVEDKLVRDKTDESFSRVFDTKVRSALALRRRIRDDVKFVVFFSSVASAFGNKGQADYASANDVLDKLAHSWQQSIPGRVLSINWGPWADAGMVSASLKTEYDRKGIGLIPPQQGVDALLRELSATGPGDPQVVLMCGKPESFGATTPFQS